MHAGIDIRVNSPVANDFKISCEVAGWVRIVDFCGRQLKVF